METPQVSLPGTALTESSACERERPLVARMLDAARSSFNTQLTSVMESLLTTAVCEITKIFEGSLSDSRVEIARSREEVARLKRQLEVLERKLKEANAETGNATGLTFDPRSYAQVPDTGAAGTPPHLPDLLTQGVDPVLGDSLQGQPPQVKEDMEVMELESVTFSEGGAGVSVLIKEEVSCWSRSRRPCLWRGMVLRGSPIDLGPWGPLPGLEGLKEEGQLSEGALQEAVLRPKTRRKQLQNPESLVGLLTVKPRCVPGQPGPPCRPTFPLPGFSALGLGSGVQDCPRRPGEGEEALEPGPKPAACTQMSSVDPRRGPDGSHFLPVPDEHALLAVSASYCPVPQDSEVTMPTDCGEELRTIASRQVVTQDYLQRKKSVAAMSDVARGSFKTQLASVMEFLLSAAVCEITKIFEGSLSDSRVEIARSREEVVRLKRQLEVLERKLKEANAETGNATGLTFDPRSYAQVPDTGAGPEMAESLPEDHMHPQGESCPLQSLQVHCTVKDELQVTELGSVTIFQDHVHIKEEMREEPESEVLLEDRGQEEPNAAAQEPITHPASPADSSPEGQAESTLGWRVRSGPGLSTAPVQRLLEVPSLTGSGRIRVPPGPPGGGSVLEGQGNAVLMSSVAVGDTVTVESPLTSERTNGTGTTDHAWTCSESSSEVSAADRLQGNLPHVAGRQTVTPARWCREKEQGDRGEVPAPVGGTPNRDAVNFVKSRYVTTQSISAPQRHHLSTGRASEGPLRGDGQDICSDPRQTAVTKGKLKYQLNPHGRERPYGCPYCGKAFFYPSQQRRHLLRHTGERLYPCSECEKSFVTPSELSLHVRIHTGEKPYSCLQCGRRFNRSGNLRAHQRDVHLGRRPHSCADCGKTFAQKGNLRTHQQRHHLAQRRFPCVE
ncbi:hypothetical protein AGOR_G00186950 [Albula goreensis]|uniref:C2H2-type domain-containing protein n=1 Tax=Albula goreensis TaxID=1534307 RepID=A0A8T3CY60_9TELE|nr:hypothetical protein AGOR_G00186950 [Albula goreensis]